jgi:hypothetical protein
MHSIGSGDEDDLHVSPMASPRNRAKVTQKGRWKTKNEWVPDRSEKGQFCKNCRTNFGLHRLLGGLPRHHCRKCGEIFCGECSSRYSPHPATGIFVRVCDSCFEAIGDIPRYLPGIGSSDFQSVLNRFLKDGTGSGEQGYTSDTEQQLQVSTNYDEMDKSLVCKCVRK